MSRVVMSMRKRRRRRRGRKGEERERERERNHDVAWESEGRDRLATPLFSSLQGASFATSRTQLLSVVIAATAA